MNKTRTIAAIATIAAATGISAQTNNKDNIIMEQELTLTEEWDKTFPQSDRVEHEKITFHNLYGITLAADLYKPKNAEGRLAAIAVSGPFGAVKEQSSGLYAQTLAEHRQAASAISFFLAQI